MIILIQRAIVMQLTPDEGARCHPHPDAHPDISQMTRSVRLARGGGNDRPPSQDRVLKKRGYPDGGKRRGISNTQT